MRLSLALSLFLILLSPAAAFSLRSLFNHNTCHYGTAPGSWVSSNQPGARWRVLSPSCSTRNLITAYLNNGTTQPLGILALSDSVDRYMLQFTCEYVNGRYVASGSHLAVPINPASKSNKTTYYLQRCESATALKLASTYLPGVHPTGPFHRNLKESYHGRVDFAKKEWNKYSNSTPDVIIVAANFWDLARLYGYERPLVSKEELSPALLEQWMANYTMVVNYTRAAFPQTKTFVFRTTLPPRHDPETGVADKPYLGRRYFVSQLNQAGREVASRLGLEVVDYEAVGNRFLDAFRYLHDLIHPARDVCIELGNIYLNIAMSPPQATDRAPSSLSSFPASDSSNLGGSSSVESGSGSTSGSASGSASGTGSEPIPVWSLQPLYQPACLLRWQWLGILLAAVVLLGLLVLVPRFVWPGLSLRDMGSSRPASSDGRYSRPQSSDGWPGGLLKTSNSLRVE